MHKIAFEIGPFPVQWYGVFVALGFLAGLWTASRRGVRDGLHPEKIMDAGPWLILGAIVGARSLYVATYWRESFAGRPFKEVFMVQHGGLVYYGGLIGATLTTLAFLRRQKLPVWKFADALAPSIALGYVFGRIGCLMNGCCFGRACDLPWAIHFPPDHSTYPAGLHPTQIYDSLLNLVFYAGLAWLYRRTQFDGQIFALYLMGYALLRAFVESFRGDYTEAHLHGFLTPAQLVSLGTFAAGAVLYWKLSRVAAAKA